MVPVDNQKTNFTVDKTLLVKGSIVTPLIKTGEITIDGKTLDQILSENIVNIDTTNLVATNLTTTNLTATNTTTTNLFLPTSGGIPTSLTYYEEFKGTVTFTSNAFNGSQTVDMLLTRIGNLVTMQLSGFTATANGVAGSFTTVTSGTSIPTRFRPNTLGGDSIFPIQVTDNFLPIIGRFTVTTAGFFTVTRSSVSTVNVLLNILFNGVGAPHFGSLGFSKFSASWIAS